MERNTVLLDLGEYNKLRDFFEGIKEDKFAVIYDNLRREYIYYEKESNVLVRLKNKIEVLRLELHSCRHPEEKEIDFKKMSIWQFMKWRRKELIKPDLIK